MPARSWMLVPLALAAFGCQREAPPLTDRQKPKPPLVQVPPELRTDAYSYYGLSKPGSRKLVARSQGLERRGEQRVEFKEMRDGRPIFTSTFTGQLSEQGTTELEVAPDGVYAISLSTGEIGGRRLELPAKMAPGTTWKDDIKIVPKTSGRDTDEFKMVNRVVGPEKVTTAAGEFDSMLVRQTGSATIGGVSGKLDIKIWLVKDLGAVRTDFDFKPSGKPSTTMRIELEK